MRTLLTLLFGPALLLALPGAGDEIVWRADHAMVVERARAEKRVLFVAVNMDDEARCEDFVDRVYDDREVRRLAQRTLNLVGSRELHRKSDGECPRLGSVSCRDHLRVEAALREAHLGVNENGAMAVPQHLWLDSKGEVLLSVPFEMSAEEMIWCFVTALRRADPELELAMPDEARPPRRLLFGRAYTPPSGDSMARGLTDDELEAEIKRLKSSLFGFGGYGSMAKILFTDHSDAVEYAEREFGRSLLTWGGNDYLRRSLHRIGVLAPMGFWIVLEDFARNNDPRVRSEVAAALEQLAAPRSYKLVKRSLSKEKDPFVERAWLRALGAVGHAESGARKTLLKAATSDDDEVLRCNAILALGHLQGHEDVRELLIGVLAAEGGGGARIAAACAMAISRDELYLAPLTEAVGEATEGDLLLALEVLRGADLLRIEAVVRRVGRDDLRRERVFFGVAGD
jgi:hypothetical protein